MTVLISDSSVCLRFICLFILYALRFVQSMTAEILYFSIF